MKILMLGWELPPYNSGGLGVACLQLAKALTEQNIEIDFVVPYLADHSEIDFMTVHAVTDIEPGERGWFEAYGTIGAGYGEEPSMRYIQEKYTRFVNNLVKNNHYDAVHAHDWLTMKAGCHIRQNHKLPFVAHVHATEFDRSGTNDGNPLIHEIEYQGLMMADKIIAVSQATKNIIVSRYGIPAEKVEVSYNAIDPTFLTKQYHYDEKTYAYLEFLKNQGYAVVTTITRFTIQKGLTFLMEAAARASQYYDKVVFLFVGDGEIRNELIALSAELGIADKVFFTGFIRGQKWRDAYTVGDVFVMSSVSEPFGLTALEAAHHDNALILTRQSGVSEMLDNIFDYDYWDVDSLADRIVAIASSQPLLQTLRSNVKNEYCQFTWIDAAKRLSQVYNEMTAGATL